MMIIIFMSLYVLSPYNTCLLTSSVESFITVFMQHNIRLLITEARII